MKKALIISTIVFLVACIAFGISVAATGLREKNFSLKIGLERLIGIESLKAGEEKTYDFSEEINDIEIATSAAEVSVRTIDSDIARVIYRSGTGGLSFSAKMEGDTLKIEEKGAFFVLFDLGDNDSQLEIFLPAKEYGDISVASASDNIDIENLVCEEFVSVTTSGDTDYEIYAENIDIYTTSGSVNASNCTDRKAENITIGSVSGNHTIKGFGTEDYNIYTTSGEIRVDGLSGKGEVALTSGEIYLSFAEWDGDISIDAVSGEVDITLPAGSGVVVDLDAVSGGVDVELETAEGEGAGTANLSGESSSGVIGGSNSHKVNVDLVSGEVEIHN